MAQLGYHPGPGFRAPAVSRRVAVPLTSFGAPPTLLNLLA